MEYLAYFYAPVTEEAPRSAATVDRAPSSHPATESRAPQLPAAQPETKLNTVLEEDCNRGSDMSYPTLYL